MVERQLLPIYGPITTAERNSGFFKASTDDIVAVYNSDTLHFEVWNGVYWQSTGRSIVTFHTSDVGNSGTGETTLYSDTIGPAIFSQTSAAYGTQVFATYGGNFVGSGTSTRQLRLKWAGTVLFNSGALSVPSNGSWQLSMTFIRTGATTARTIVTLVVGALTTEFATETDLTGLDFTIGQNLDITAQAANPGAADNAIMCKLVTVEWSPSPGLPIA